MATTPKSEKIMIGIGDEVIELTGEAKEAFLADREAAAKASALLEAEYQAKKELRTNAITKLGQASGLTEEEINAILGL
jgi:hypothetical protein